MHRLALLLVLMGPGVYGQPPGPVATSSSSDQSAGAPELFQHRETPTVLSALPGRIRTQESARSDDSQILRLRYVSIDARTLRSIAATRMPTSVSLNLLPETAITVSLQYHDGLEGRTGIWRTAYGSDPFVALVGPPPDSLRSATLPYRVSVESAAPEYSRVRVRAVSGAAGLYAVEELSPSGLGAACVIPVPPDDH